MPENFFEELKEKEEREAMEQKLKKDLLMGSYKRPRRQRAPEALHPADERKLQAQRAMEEQQKRETTVRQEMRILHDAIQKRKEKQNDDDYY